MQKNFWVTIHNVSETTTFWKSKTVKHRTVYLSLKKMETYNLEKIYIYVIFGGISAFHINF